MSPELVEEGVVCLLILAGYLLVLGIGCLIADFVFPHIPFIERFLDSLPEFEDDEELERLERERIRRHREARRTSRKHTSGSSVWTIFYGTTTRSRPWTPTCSYREAGSA